MVWPRQRLRMVGSSWCAASVARMNFTAPGGSSSVLSRVLAVTLFMRSAGNTSTTLVVPRERVNWVKDTASRAASTLISLLGLRFLPSSSSWVSSSSGQPSASDRVSGISMQRSAWVCTSTAWQLPQWPQAPCGVASSQSQARARASASSNWPRPDGPLSSQAWPRWTSRLSSWVCSQGARGGLLDSAGAFTVSVSLMAASPWP